MTFLFWLDWTLFALAALSTAYIFFFSLAASLYNRCHRATPPAAVEARQRFLFLIPAYGEDAVIQQTADKALAVDYPSHLMHVAVISDHMSDATNQALALKPLTLFIATYDNSTKAKALQMAMHGTTFESDYVVILDADNHVDADFLTRLSSHLALMRNPVAVQCHRTAKNTNTSTAILDAVSEEVNNHIFRLGHKAVGLSSALIGSGMCLQT
ncbi:MAG: glycosyltransferase, partial [Bacteroidaceae bacterium]|nr:glycosyltransferase [Bacteroidaceae bacterium]